MELTYNIFSILYSSSGAVNTWAKSTESMFVRWTDLYQSHIKVNYFPVEKKRNLT